MHDARIVIADSKDNSRRLLKDLLTRSGFKVQAEARNAPELLRKARTLYPELVILDSNLEGGSTMEIAGIIEDDSLSNILVITEDSNRRKIDNFAHVIKPYNEETLLSVLETCLLYNSKFTSIRQEVDKLKDSLNNRKIIEKAKGIIMKTMDVGEEDAYRKMQKESMDSSISMKDLARAIIAAYEINK